MHIRIRIFPCLLIPCVCTAKVQHVSNGTWKPVAEMTADQNAAAQAYMDKLVAELRARGLEVAAKLPAMTVRNPMASSTDPRGRALFPGLTQQVLIRWVRESGLMWCWVWRGFRPVERDASESEPEVEPMCHAKDIERAAELIANVVRLRDSKRS